MPLFNSMLFYYFLYQLLRLIQEIMIRLSFNKIEFSENILSEQTFIEIQSEGTFIFKLKPKKIKNHLSRYYGDFVELESNNMNLKLKVFTIDAINTPNLVEKISLKKVTYGLLQKKSHFFETVKIKIWFDSEKIDAQNSKTQDTTTQSISFTTNSILNDRMGLRKILREFSPQQKFTMTNKLSIGACKKTESKNMTMKISHKSPFKDMMKVKI